jgi:hypothetical protein
MGGGSQLAANWKLLALIVAVCGALGVVNIPVAAPVHLQGQLQVSGRLASCEFSSLGRSSRYFFVGVRLQQPSAPMIRANPELKRRREWESLCARKPVLHIYYHARKRLVGPVRFWLDRYNER